jgi:hypothetical protein
MSRVQLGEHNGRAKLTPNDVREIRANPRKQSQRKLADKYGVSTLAIHHVVHHITWRHIT